MPDDLNPYASPQHASEPATATLPPTREQVHRLLFVPAWGMIASAILSFFMLACWLFWTGILMVAYQPAIGLDLTWAIAILAGCSYSSFKAYLGGLAMLRLVDYRAALRGAWYAFIPCNVCCLLALPFALYADWLLRKPEIHAAFSPERLRLLSRRKGNATS
ncbi:MAG: hypothetical protein WD872_14755 [Pirellulaceae bacterium]